MFFVTFKVNFYLRSSNFLFLFFIGCYYVLFNVSRKTETKRNNSSMCFKVTYKTAVLAYDWNVDCTTELICNLVNFIVFLDVLVCPYQFKSARRRKYILDISLVLFFLLLCLLRYAIQSK